MLHQKIAAASLLIVFFSTLSASAHAEVGEEYFSIPSSTPKVNIKGSLVQPISAASKELPTIILVGGTYTSGDGELYAPPSGNARLGKFWYRDLALHLAKKGYRVVRFDNRGLGSILRCEKQIGRPLKLTEYAFNPDCFDLNAAGTTTSETRTDDLMQVINMVERRWNSSSLVMITHSEGIIPTAKLTQMGKIHPLAMVFIGGFASSSSDLFHWQLVDREIEWLQDIADRHNGLITNADIDKLPYEKTRHYGPMELLKWETESFDARNLGAIKSRLEARYERELKELVTASPDTTQSINLSDNALANVPVTKASYVADLLSDKTSILDRIKDYRGKVTYIFGQDDVLINVDAQMRYIASSTQPEHLSTIKVQNMNHSLSNPDGSLNRNGLAAIMQAVEVATMNVQSADPKAEKKR